MNTLYKDSYFEVFHETDHHTSESQVLHVQNTKKPYYWNF